MTVDVLVVGAGPAGLSTGLSANRTGLETTVLEAESVGGELVNRNTIENLPGHLPVSGTELRSTLVEQFRAAGGLITLGTVERIHDGDPFLVTTTGGEYRSRSVVLATGGRPSPLGIPGEETYTGRGVFHCATCDGPLYVGETVAVAGSSDWAATDALFLTNHVDHVVLIESGDRLDAGDALRDRLTDHSAVDVRTQTEITEIQGEEVLERLRLVDRDDGREYVESVGGLYVQQGIEPATDAFSDIVSLNDRGEVVVEAGLETDTSGIFAAGDVRQSSPRTVAAAIGDGVTAAHSAASHVERSQ
ncbi:NAD(P)/FAD-dependent oxidoreductase [Natrialbaceae archaeon GCM10025810]|uniref:NAD(P)/FAD-dependent oxidoreductase n=1 Tax=Halovalidus salilacus TaxID=3075124 RepID=UPI003610E7BC